MTTLLQVVQRVGPLDVRRAARYIDEIAQQLAELHARGSFPNDIRPATITLDDYGHARLAPPRSRLPEDDLGDVDYLAPEQALNQQVANERCDLYALGCTFCFLLTTRPPFDGGSVSERLLAHQKAPPPDLTAERPDAPRALTNLCARLLAKGPSDRPQSAEEVSGALNAWLVDDERS